jgi:hypothetical protein
VYVAKERMTAPMCVEPSTVYEEDAKWQSLALQELRDLLREAVKQVLHNAPLLA